MMQPGAKHRIAKQLRSGVFLFSLGCALSFAGWGAGGGLWFLLLLWGAAFAMGKTAAGVFVLTSGYYLSASWASITAVSGFFEFHMLKALAVWLSHGLILASAWALPVLILNLIAPVQRLLGRALLPVAICCGALLSVAPPWSSLSWGHPLLISGHLYPGGGFSALLAVLSIWVVSSYLFCRLRFDQYVSGVASMPAFAVLWAAMLATLLAIGLGGKEDASNSRAGGMYLPISTNFGKISGPDERLDRINHWFRPKLESLLFDPGNQGKTIVFPEGILGWHDPGLDMILKSMSWLMAERQISVVIHTGRIHEQVQNRGTVTLSSVSFYDGRGYQGSYTARHVVPRLRASMRSGSESGSPVFDVPGGERSYVIAACYEALLMEHWMASLWSARTGRVDHVLGVASLWFVGGVAGEWTEAVMRLHLKRGALLHGVPSTLAVNRSPQAATF